MRVTTAPTCGGAIEEERPDALLVDIARHVEVADAGTRLPADRLRPNRLRAVVHEATSKKAGAEHVAAAFAAAGGPKAAAGALEELPRDREARKSGKGWW